MTFEKPVLHIKDVVETLGISVATIHRWLRAARQGESRFPLPINEKGMKLIWTADSIENFLAGEQPVPVPKVESAAQRRKRHNAAMESLEKRHGITIRK